MKLEWIAVDWGTSNLRVWGLDAQNRVLTQASSASGMGGLQPDAFEPALLKLVGNWLDQAQVPVVACGMVGAAQGWVDAGYQMVPTGQHLRRSAVKAATNDPRLQVQVLGGLSQDKPADVMRGEETQIAGFLADNEGFSGIICLPGTHTKWVQITDSEVFHFATFMTGEIYALLSTQSVLRHSVSNGMQADAFAEALNDTLSHPEKIAAKLFSLRAESLLSGLDTTVAGSRLSGMLLGLEMAGARPYWLGQNVVLMADGLLKDVYTNALNGIGVSAETADPEACVLKGLIAAKIELETAP